MSDTRTFIYHPIFDTLRLGLVSVVTVGRLCASWRGGVGLPPSGVGRGEGARHTRPQATRQQLRRGATGMALAGHWSRGSSVQIGSGRGREQGEFGLVELISQMTSAVVIVGGSGSPEVKFNTTP